MNTYYIQYIILCINVYDYNAYQLIHQSTANFKNVLQMFYLIKLAAYLFAEQCSYCPKHKTEAVIIIIIHQNTTN